MYIYFKINPDGEALYFSHHTSRILMYAIQLYKFKPAAGRDCSKIHTNLLPKCIHRYRWIPITSSDSRFKIWHVLQETYIIYLGRIFMIKAERRLFLDSNSYEMYYSCQTCKTNIESKILMNAINYWISYGPKSHSSNRM